MNVPPDMLRQGMPPLPPQMLSLNAPQFLQTQSQPGQQSPNHMGLLPNSNNPNPPIGILAGQSAAITPAMRYQMQLQQAQQVNHNMQQANQQRRNHMLLQPSQGGQSLNPPGGAAPGSHMGSLGHNQLQNMGFQNPMIAQSGSNPQVRRVASQPQPLNQSSAHMGGMQQGVGGMSMGMNAQTSMPPQLRQAQQQQQHQQQQQQLNLRMQQQMQGRMSPEMAMSLRQGNPGLPQNVARTASGQAQLMSNLSQPPTLTQAHSSHHRDGFQNSVPLPHQHQPTQLSSSPRPGSHSQAHTPNMSMTTPGPAQGPPNRSRTTPDNSMFLPFQNPQFQQTPLNPSRLPGNNGQFPFVPSSTPPNQHSDMANGIGNTPGSGTHGDFQVTPAQQYEQMQDVVGYGSHFNMPPPQSNIPPPRPTSHNNHRPPGPLPLPQQHQQQPRHHSPHHSDPMGTSHPQRPHSQPQAQRPPSQSGPSHTPRASQPQLPANPILLPPNRIISQHQGPPPPSQSQSTAGHHLVIGPRQQPSNPASASSSAASSSALPPSEGGPPHGQGIGIPRGPNTVLHVGVGQGLVRLLQFSGILANENKTKLQLSYWDSIVKEYFTPKAVMKFTLWKDNQRTEAKPFEIGVPILPRFFLVTTQSGVKSMTLSLDGARERLFSTGHAVVECVTAVWTYKYSNGYTVTLRGPLTAHVVLCASTSLPQSTPFVLKFENLQFDANLHDKYIALESIVGQRGMESPNLLRTPTANGSAAQQREEDKKWEEPRVTIKPASIPGEPVNAFGIPQATMRCLELAESVGQMADLISFSNETELGPLEALSKFALKIRESQPLNQGQGGNGLLNGSSQFQAANGGVVASPAVSLYSSLPQSANSSNPQPIQSGSSPQNTPSSADNSPQKQNKSILQSQGSGSSSAPSSTPAAPSSSNTTPSMANASLKRKQTSDAASPTTTNPEQALPPKRGTRKRGRTAGG